MFRLNDRIRCACPQEEGEKKKIKSNTCNAIYYLEVSLVYFQTHLRSLDSKEDQLNQGARTERL